MARSHRVQVGKNHFEVPAELPQHLPARAARRRRPIGVGDNGDAPERSMAFGDGFEDRNALGAHREPVGGVLDVRAGDDPAVGRFQRGADFEVRKRRVRALPRKAGGLDDVRLDSGRSRGAVRCGDRSPGGDRRRSGRDRAGGAPLRYADLSPSAFLPGPAAPGRSPPPTPRRRAALR